MNREAERKRLVELCEDVVLSCKSSLCADCEHNKIDYPHCMSEHFADHLLDNGIVVPPVKVGDKVWLISENGSYVYDIDVEIVFWDRDGCYIETRQHDGFTDEDFGKTVFLTREEAEVKLKGEGE